ncbi:MAG TPA: hypothetical protein DDY70_06505 [Clostridiales bacterium]|nr:hypothetical protein [Clostridiales bacterium]
MVPRKYASENGLSFSGAVFSAEAHGSGHTETTKNYIILPPHGRRNGDSHERVTEELQPRGL